MSETTKAIHEMLGRLLKCQIGEAECRAAIREILAARREEAEPRTEAA